MENKALIEEIKQEIAKIKKRKIKKKKKLKGYKLDDDVIEDLANIVKDEDLKYNQLFKIFIKNYKNN